MAQISKTDVEHVAELARLKLTEEEKEKFTQELGEILSYIDELAELKDEKIEPISQIGGLENIVRKDEITNKNNREDLLSNAPTQHDGYIKVKQIFE